MVRLSILLILISPFIGVAQNNNAQSILENIQTKYDQYSSFESDFELTISLPNETPMVQKGRAYQKNDMFCLEMEEQHIISDGKAIWTYSKSENRANITNFDEGVAMNSLSPGQILNDVLQKENKYKHENIKSENGKKIQLIEIATTDRDEEYFKFHVKIDPKTNQILSIKTFLKDGSRILLSISNFKPNVKIEDSFFVFNKQKYPGVEIEDLRL